MTNHVCPLIVHVPSFVTLFSLARQPDSGGGGGLGTYRPVWASGGRMEHVPDT